ncbi:MAG: dTMP kinase [Gemmatimonadales bacterium]|nr:dTMP kinase [Gemmatimonadales bacterium]
MGSGRASSGIFVALEGIEGAGKTSQLMRLAERLRGLGREPVVVREPGGTPVAEEARQLILHAPHDLSAASELFLFLTARADLMQRVIRPALESGQVVLADRFELSTRCYQAAGRGLDLARVEGAIALATGGLQPDLYVVLDVPVEAGQARQAAEGKAPDKIERADTGFHRRVAEAFRNAAAPNILHLSADRPFGAVHDELWDALAGRFPLTFSGVAG